MWINIKSNHDITYIIRDDSINYISQYEDECNVYFKDGTRIEITNEEFERLSSLLCVRF